MPREISKCRILVTSKNHNWAAKVTGLEVEEVTRLYREARDAGYVCTLEATVTAVRAANRDEGVE